MKSLNRKDIPRSVWIGVLALSSLFSFGNCSLVMGDLPKPAPAASAGVANGGNAANSAGGGGNVTGGGASAGQASAGTNATVGGAGGMTSSGGVAGSGITPQAGTDGGGSGGTGSGGTGSGGTGACDPCDCDDDGYQNETCDGGGGAAPDCDDSDWDANPGQMGFFAEARNIGGFDYDCDNATEREYPTPLDTCPAIQLGACDPKQGFLSPLPACGTEGPWAVCQKTQSGLGCEPSVLEDRVVKCH